MDYNGVVLLRVVVEAVPHLLRLRELVVVGGGVLHVLVLAGGGVPQIRPQRGHAALVGHPNALEALHLRAPDLLRFHVFFLVQLNKG